MSRRINRAALALLKRYEGLRLKAYLCPAGVPTIGWGHTATVTMEDVRTARTITASEAEALLRGDLGTFTSAVERSCTIAPNENQFGAMVVLCYNIGVAGFRSSSVLKAHNRGDWQSAARAFGLWNKARNPATGKLESLAGLTSRRSAEAALYLVPVAAEQTADSADKVSWRPESGSAQAVEVETQLVASPIAQAGTVTVVSSGVATAAEIARGVGDIRWSLGEWLPYIALFVAGIAGIYIVYTRYKQRKLGWA